MKLNQMKVFAGLSFICCTFVFLTWYVRRFTTPHHTPHHNRALTGTTALPSPPQRLVHPKKRTGKGRYVFAFNTSIFALSLVVLIPIGLNNKHVASFGCKDNRCCAWLGLAPPPPPFASHPSFLLCSSFFSLM